MPLTDYSSAFRTLPMNSTGLSGLSTNVIPLVRLIRTGVLNDVANIAPKRIQGATPGAGRTSAIVLRGMLKPYDHPKTMRMRSGHSSNARGNADQSTSSTSPATPSMTEAN